MRNNTVSILGLAAAMVSLAADQVVKTWAIAAVAVRGEMQAGQWLNIVAVENTGVAFGIAAASRPWILIGIGLALATGLSVWLLRTRSKFQAIGLGFAIGGALGNIADRILLGSVRDFLDFHWDRYHWPAFNLADVFILIGLSIVVFINERKEEDKGYAPRSGQGLEQTPLH